MKTPVQLVTVDESRDGQRIDNFLLANLKGVPRTLIYRLLRKGEVRVNKGRAKPELKLKTGDIVRIPPLELPDAQAPAQAGSGLLRLLQDCIVFENNQLLVVNKPAGLAVHGGSGIKLGLIEALRQLRPQEKMLELVHRLDRDTSGLILVARKRSALTALHADLREGRVDKRYLAVVHGHWPAKLDRIDAPLLKNELAGGERYVKVSSQGKASRTGFELLEAKDGFSLIEARPYTGRTHQIRVHAKHAGFALAGDSKYASEEQQQAAKAAGFKRLCLHAHQLSFTLPGEGSQLTVTAPLAEDIAAPWDQRAI